MAIEINLDGTIPDQFNTVVSLVPERTAISLEGETITYAELNHQSRLVSNFLINELGDTQTPIPVLHASQKRMIPLLAGIVNSGHMYSAMSGHEPAARISSVLRDLDAPFLVVCDPNLLSLGHEVCPPGMNILLFDQVCSTTDTPLKVNLKPESCAVINFTSGSTGEPKGVLRTHKMILHQAWTFQDQFGFGMDSRMLAIRPYSTASSLTELFVPILNGAPIVPFDLQEDGLGRLSQVLKKEKISIMRLPIQAMRTFLENLPAGETFPDIQYIFATGDVFYRKDVEKLRQIISPNAVIVHQISMSETGLLAVNKIYPDTDLDSEVVPAGVPVKGKEVLIIDENGNLLPVGEVGEIHVRTKFSFPGYWHATEKKFDRFVPDPTDESQKIFATGDLGRIRSDGQLEHLGRIDWRVKIRGFSVDLSAIEHVLMTSRKVQRAVVIAATNPDAQKKLVAYILPAAGEKPSRAELIDLVSARLPDYMIPSLVIMVSQVPLTISGKIDRKALPIPDWTLSQSATVYAAPQDAVEKKLVSIWQKSFNINKIGVQDDFFELGGDSLLAAGLFVEIERFFGQSFPLSILLKYPTISSLAGLLRKETKVTELEHLVALRTEDSKPPLFLAPGAGADTITFIELVDALCKDQPVYGLEDFHIGTSQSIYVNGIRTAALEFIKAIKKVQASGPYYLGGHSFGGVLAFEIACQLSLAGEKVAFLMVLDSAAPIRDVNKTGTLAKRIETHKANLNKKSLKEIFQYFFGRIQWRLKLLSRNKWVQKLYGTELLKDRLWNDSHRYPFMARTDYKPGIYPGNLIVYRATEKPPAKTWDITAAWPDFVSGKVTYYDVPGNHKKIIKKPNVVYLAELLSKHLEQAFDRTGH